LSSGRTVTVRVLEQESGVPIAGAQVQVPSQQAVSSAHRRSAEASTTAADGTLVLDQLEDGTALSVVHAEFLSATAVVPPGAEQVTVSMSRGGRVLGTVLSAAGAPLARMEVTAISQDGKGSRSGTTNERGEFEIRPLLPGTFRVVPRTTYGAKAIAFEPKTVVITGGGTPAQADFREVADGGRLMIHGSDSVGDDVMVVAVLIPAPASPPTSYEAYRELQRISLRPQPNRGRPLFESVPPGSYLLLVMQPDPQGLRVHHEPVTLRPGSDTTLKVRLTEDLPLLVRTK
jgi:hypothetical protein